MNPAQLLSHFDRISEAPDAIPRLRQFILDLAVRGRVVEQDPKDEPASELLKRIQAEKERLLKAGEIRKQEASRPIDVGEAPFDIPPGWCWMRLIGVLNKLTDGTHHSPTNLADSAFKYITAKNIKPEGVSLANVSYVTAKVHHEIYARCNPEKGDILYIKDGATTGIVTINNLDEPFSMLSSVALLKLSNHVYRRLIVEFLRSPFFYNQMRGFMKGAAITRVTLKRMAPALIPLPPLAEQHRIVAKVDELMALCDRLETAQAERESRRDRLAASSLHRLNNGADSDAFRDQARFYFNHLPCLTTNREHIQQLRQTILNLAVRGQLVPQDSNEEAASKLFERIMQAKLALLDAKKLKVSKKLEPEVETDFTFSIPAGWIGTRLGNIYDVRDGTHDTPKYFDEGYPLITSKNLSSGRLLFDDVKFISEKDHRQISARSAVERENILLAMIGSIGNPVIVDTDRPFSIKNVALFKYYDRSLSDPGFLCIFLHHATDEMRRLAAGGLQPFVSLGFLRNYPIALPPLAEQQRIVAKVEELMALCDRLEAQLTTTQTESRRLLEAVLHEALSGRKEHELVNR